MSLNDPVMDALLAALRMLNEMRPPEKQLSLSPETPIMGARADLDSMDLVNLFLFAEETLTARGLKTPNLIEMAGQAAETLPSLSLESLGQQIRTVTGRSSGG